MKSNIILKVFFLFLFLMVDLFAVEGNVKLFIKEYKTLYTSQKITVSVILMTDAFSISEARIDFPSSPNYIVEEPKSAAFLNQEKIDGVAWQQVHYEYDVYALRAGKMEIPPMNISFAGSMGYGQEKKAFEFKSEVLSFQVESPKGIENNRFVLVTDKYTLASDLKPKKKTLIVGDAVEITVLQKAQGVPDILLTPIVYKSNTHLRVYDKEPLLENSLSGDLDVSRTDSFTFVATAEGNVTIPSQETVWWNSSTKKVQKEMIPEMTFEIIADPQIAMDAQKEKQKQILIYAVLFLALLTVLYMILAPYLKKYRTEQKRIYEKSEEAKYDKLVNSIEEGDPSVVYTDFYAWLAMNEYEVPLNTFKDIYEVYPELKSVLLTFEQTLIGKSRFNKSACLLTIKSMRRTFQNVELKNRSGLENSLNP